MEILMESILQMLPPDAQTICHRPTAKIIGLKKLNQDIAASGLDFLYIDTEPDLNQIASIQQGNFMIYYPDDLPEEAAGIGTNLLVIKKLDEYVDMLTKISDQLSNCSQLDNISQEMISIVHRGGDVHKLLKYAYELLNNPLMLVDVSFNLLAHVGTGVLKDEVAWSYAIDNKMFSSKYISYIMNRSAFADEDHLIKGGAIRVELPNEVTSVTQYSARIAQNNVVLGYVKLLEANHPVSDFDLEVFKTLSYYLPFTRTNLKGKIPDIISLTEDFLLSLLEQRITDKYEILSRQELYNLKFYKYLYVISIHFNGLQSTNDIIAFTLHQVRSYFHNNLVIQIDGSFVVLYDSQDDNIAHSPNWLEQLSKFLEKLNCTANISTPFKELHNISNYYKQTQFCTEFRTLSRDTEQKRILLYRDIFEYHMILSLAKEVNLADLLHPAVKILSENTNSSADLLNTLFVYTRNHCSIPNTAKTMYLHYNTLKNRINRIETLTGFNGEDSRDCFWIALSERILKILSFEEFADPSEAKRA